LIQSPNHSWQNSLELIATLDEIRQDIGLFYPGEDGSSDHHHHHDEEDLHHHHHEHGHHKH
jgi:hypothetical protein